MALREQLAVRFSRRRVISALAAVALLTLAPAGATAAPDPSSCASFRNVYYVMDLPAGYWPAGAGPVGVEYIFTIVDAAGNSFPFQNAHYFQVDANSVAYRGNVLIRLFSNFGMLADGSVDFDVQSIRASQPTELMVQEFFDKGTNVALDTVIARTFRNGQWGDWTQLPQGPSTTVCAPGGNAHFGGLFWQHHGWAQ
jgi:hypothetical protein